jgi:hypothetical protein
MLVEYYFDTETTGIEPNKDKIITIQWQPLSRLSGEQVGELKILKEWESSEESIIRQFLSEAQCENPFEFIMVGKNLLFDFNFLSKRSARYGISNIDLRFFYGRVWLDIKPILVLMNRGNFRGYDRVMDRGGELSEVDVPNLYKCRRYEDIVRYISQETQTFIRFYQMLKKEMPSIGANTQS